MQKHVDRHTFGRLAYSYMSRKIGNRTSKLADMTEEYLFACLFMFVLAFGMPTGPNISDVESYPLCINCDWTVVLVKPVGNTGQELGAINRVQNSARQ